MANVLSPGQAFPVISVPTLGGKETKLYELSGSKDWKLVIVYRGLHCPLCTRYLTELDNALDQLRLLNVNLIAVSADNKSQANEHMAQVNPRFDIGYDLSIPQMEELGLFISGTQNGQNVRRPFAEPGLFVINEEGKIQILDVSNVPFARPSVASILMGLNYLRQNDGAFPINGIYTVQP